MSAYIVIELDVVDAEAKNLYSQSAAPIVKKFGGEFITGGTWNVLSGSDSFKFGAIIKFESKEIALQWYHSEEYQSLIPLREKGMNSRFSIIG